MHAQNSCVSVTQTCDTKCCWLRAIARQPLAMTHRNDESLSSPAVKVNRAPIILTWHPLSTIHFVARSGTLRRRLVKPANRASHYPIHPSIAAGCLHFCRTSYDSCWLPILAKLHNIYRVIYRAYVSLQQSVYRYKVHQCCRLPAAAMLVKTEDQP